MSCVTFNIEDEWVHIWYFNPSEEDEKLFIWSVHQIFGSVDKHVILEKTFYGYSHDCDGNKEWWGKLEDIKFGSNTDFRIEIGKSENDDDQKVGKVGKGLIEVAKLLNNREITLILKDDFEIDGIFPFNVKKILIENNGTFDQNKIEKIAESFILQLEIYDDQKYNKEQILSRAYHIITNHEFTYGGVVPILESEYIDLETIKTEIFIWKINNQELELEDIDIIHKRGVSKLILPYISKNDFEFPLYEDMIIKCEDGYAHKQVVSLLELLS